MKVIITAVMVAFAAMSVQAAEPAKKEEQNCVKKDKKGNCPAAPKSPKPTPKKKAEAK
jgi:hypothetical protein